VEAIDVADPTRDCEVKVLMVSRMMERVAQRRDRKSGQVPGYLLVLDFAVGLKSIFAATSALTLLRKSGDAPGTDSVPWHSVIHPCPRLRS
jgi:hypothetical protein